MGTPYLGQISVFSFGFPPKGWALCNGQLLPINQNQALYSLLGNTYGGDGRVNFGLPNLQGRVTVGVGGGLALGNRGGEEAHTLNASEMPSHSHSVTGTGANANATSPVNLLPAASPSNPYSSGSTDVAMLATEIGNTGGSQPHENRSPYAVLCICIALQGAFPSQN